MNVINRLSEKTWYGIIIAISFILVAVVSLLIYKARFVTTYSSNVFILPKMNAFINGTVSILLMVGYYFIRFRKNRKIHRACMILAFVLSVMFLISYVIYHNSAPEVRYGDLNYDHMVDAAEKAQAGPVRYVYYFLLASHIILASAIVPMILLTLFRIARNQVVKHKKIARWTFPLWLYVSVTGVIVYLMISQYYPGG